MSICQQLGYLNDECTRQVMTGGIATQGKQKTGEWPGRIRMWKNVGRESVRRISSRVVCFPSHEISWEWHHPGRKCDGVMIVLDPCGCRAFLYWKSVDGIAVTGTQLENGLGMTHDSQRSG